MKTPMRRSLVAMLALLTAAPASLASEYVVRRGDTLSSIAKENLGLPIYGPTGNLRQLMQLNPEIKNADQIEIGQRLRLKNAPAAPESVSAPAPASPEPSVAAETPPPVEAPPPAEAPVAEATPASRKGHGLYIELAAAVYDTSIAAKNTATPFDATLRSGKTPAVRLGLGYRSASGWRLGGFGELARQSYDTAAGGLFKESKLQLVAFGAELGYAPIERLELSAAYGLAQSPFLAPASGGGLEMTAVRSDRLRLGADLEALRFERFGLGLAAGWQLRSAADGDAVKTRSGSAVDAKVYWRGYFDRVMPEVGFVFEKAEQDSNVADQSATTAGLRAAVAFYLN